MKFSGIEIGNFKEPYVIAEIGANHNGDVEFAKKMIDVARDIGCHSAKFQSWSKESIFSRQVYEENYFLGDDYRDRNDYTLEEIVEEFSTSPEELAELKAYCDSIGIGFSSTPFCAAEVDFLVDELDVDFIKIASMDCNNYPFLDYVARKKKPVVLSTGLSAMHEIARAVDTIESAGNREIVILHCIAQYPPVVEHTNLNNIDMLRENFPEYPVGFSDHSIGTTMPLAAIVKGACLIEKHFTLDKDMFGWDHKVSATPYEMAAIVEQGKVIPKALGSYRRTVTEADILKRTAFRRSVVAAQDLPAGHKIERADLDLKRPGTGIAPERLDSIVGRITKREIKFDRMLTEDDF